MTKELKIFRDICVFQDYKDPYINPLVPSYSDIDFLREANIDINELTHPNSFILTKVLYFDPEVYKYIQEERTGERRKKEITE